MKEQTWLEDFSSPAWDAQDRIDIHIVPNVDQYVLKLNQNPHMQREYKNVLSQ